MRNPLILAAFLVASLIAPAAGQTRQPPPLEVNAEQRADLARAVTRGRALAVLDQAARITTQDMLTRLPNPDEAGIVGWIAQVEGNGVAVTYFAREGDGYAAVYKAQMLSGRVTSPRVFPSGSRPVLTGVAARMAAARIAADAIEREACGQFNAVVMPPEGEGPVLVYRLGARTGNAVPGGGHYRFAIDDDGSIADEASLGSATCTEIALPAPAAGARPAPLRINAAGTDWPNELHVFLATATGRPVVVAAGGDPVRLWGVSSQGIGELQQQDR